MAHPPEIQALLDKQAIYDILARYSRGVDRADVDLVAGCYHPDATENHGGTFTGTAADYLAAMREVLPASGIMTHNLSNVLIELDGDKAVAESYNLAFVRMVKRGETFDTLTHARAVDEFERRDGEWRIAARHLTYEWNIELPFNETWARGIITKTPEVLVRGGKKPKDILYGR